MPLAEKINLKLKNYFDKINLKQVNKQNDSIFKPKLPRSHLIILDRRQDLISPLIHNF